MSDVLVILAFVGLWSLGIYASLWIAALLGKWFG